MFIKKMEVCAEDSLVILDDRGRLCQSAIGFLTEKFKEAGCDKTLYMFVQIKLEDQAFGLLKEKFPQFSSDTGGVCIFPGRSAARIRENAERNDCYVGKVLDCNTFESIYATRHIDRYGNAKASAAEAFPSVTVCLKTRVVIVFDDVISTGVTMRACYEKNHHKFPGAEWFACAPISRQEKIKGYREVFAPVVMVLDSRGMKVPINSLSTLIGDCEIGKRYAVNHCAKPEVLLAAFEVVRTQYEECDSGRVVCT